MKTLRLKLLLVFLILIYLISACNRPGVGDEWYVATTGDDNNHCLSLENACLTIQAAIDKAGVNGSIFIAAGTYDGFWITTENGIDRHLQLIGAGPDETIIDGNYSGTVIVNNEATTTLDSMTIKHGSSFVHFPNDRTAETGGGIFNRAGYLVINNSHIIDNEEKGVTNTQGGRLLITNSTIANNQSSGVHIRDEGNIVDISNSLIFNNGRYGVSLWSVSESSITNSNIYSNGWGGIFSRRSEYSLSDSKISGNGTREQMPANGGLIIQLSSVTITRSFISDNTSNDAPGAGLHIECDFNQIQISDSTISGNQTNAGGGGIYNRGCLILMRNVTISGNIAGSGGSAISNGSDQIMGSITISHSTITGNLSGDAGAGIKSTDGSEVIIINSIVAFNGNTNCNGNVLSGGFNLESNDTCGFNAPGDLTNTDPLLGPLADNGGGTDTHGLMPGSPAIDTAGDANCLPADQRGVGRPQGQACDIGAFESEELRAEGLPTIPVTIQPQEQESECTVTVRTNLFCRPGPGYAPSDSFTPGQSTTAYAQSPDGNYLFVRGINDNRDCTVPNDPKYVEVTGQACSTLPQQQLPPTPIAPTITATSPPTSKPLSAPNPASPSGTLVCGDVMTGGVTLVWSAVSNPNGIDHYEWALEGAGTESGSTGNTQASTSGLSCAGANYQWRVRAVDGKGNIGPWSGYLQFNVP